MAGGAARCARGDQTCQSIDNGCSGGNWGLGGDLSIDPLVVIAVARVPAGVQTKRFKVSPKPKSHDLLVVLPLQLLD